MPTTINGRRVGVSVNGKFSTKNTDPIYLGRLWNGAGIEGAADAAASWNAMRAAALLDGIPSAHFAPGGPASSARSIEQQNYFWAHRPPPAAYPGTSNHGWGIAVDIPFADAQAWLRKNAHRFGWGNTEGKRVGEAWHWTWERHVAVKRSKLSGYPADELRWIREYDRLKRAGKDAPRRAVLVRVMKERRKLVWHAAQGSGGWSKLKRRERYRSLLARTS